MSVLLSNMELPPKGCSYCIEIFGDGTWSAIEESEYHGRAVDVPVPHGRCIDADRYDFPGDLIDEPTIIEAEEAEDVLSV